MLAFSCQTRNNSHMANHFGCLQQLIACDVMCIFDIKPSSIIRFRNSIASHLIKIFNHDNVREKHS
jgi:hypothetical protein